MEVILKETIDTLGQEGEIVKIKPGYGRNYLLPQGKAVLATKSNLAILEQERTAIQARIEQQRQQADALTAKLTGITVIIQQRAGEEGRLFGSVTSSDIAEKLTDLGFAIDRKKILLDEPLKSLGDKQVTIKTGYQQSATITVSIQEFKEESKAAEAEGEASSPDDAEGVDEDAMEAEA